MCSPKAGSCGFATRFARFAHIAPSVVHNYAVNEIGPGDVGVEHPNHVVWFRQRLTKTLSGFLSMKLSSPVKLAAISIALVGSGCTVYQAPTPRQHVYAQPVPAVTYAEPAPQAVVSVYVEPPILQPAPILIGWAPPPMLVEPAIPLPYASAVWVGGYWVWEGNWVWAAGHWMAPPRPNYAWVQPYYEHRDAGVVFITGHWSPPGTVFLPPAIGLTLTLVVPLSGTVPGPRPIGPQGVFVPPPPGSRFGLIVPAPIGTAPAVVTSAAPVVNVGMRIQNNSNTTINNTRVTNVTNITNVTNVSIVAPASATANGKAFEGTVPAQAHLAAALPAMIRAPAPVPMSAVPIPAFTASRAPVTVPPPQVVRSSTAPAPLAPPQRAFPVVSATATAVSPVGAAAVAAAPASLTESRPTVVHEPAGAVPAQPAQSAEAPRRPARVASVVLPASASTRTAAAQSDEARSQAVRERRAKAEAAAQHPAKTTHAKKKDDEQKVGKEEK